MKKGFYWIMSAQFFSSLADNALLIVAIDLLREISAPAWATPMLKFTFVVSYVLLAAFVAAFADSRPKGRVMFITNVIKITGLLTMVFFGHPLIAYGIVGLGAAAYSPAKYGILTELLPPEQLVKANGWIEGTTVISIILGMGLGGFLIRPDIGELLQHIGMPAAYSCAKSALWVVLIFYIVAALCNLCIPDTGARYPKVDWRISAMLKDFGYSVKTLWGDKLGQIALSVTTLFWGAGATLQFIVLEWAQQSLGLTLSQASYLMAVFAVGITFGAIGAAAFIPLKKSLNVMWVGIVMGGACVAIAFLDKNSVPAIDIFGFPLYMIVACACLVVIGAMAGFLVVPLNALLQHRGHVRLTAGHSIAVQNFNENIGILVMLAVYALLIKGGFSTQSITVMFGVFVGGTIALIIVWNRFNMRARDWTKIIGEEKK